MKLRAKGVLKLTDVLSFVAPATLDTQKHKTDLRDDQPARCAARSVRGCCDYRQGLFAVVTNGFNLHRTVWQSWLAAAADSHRWIRFALPVGQSYSAAPRLR